LKYLKTFLQKKLFRYLKTFKTKKSLHCTYTIQDGSSKDRTTRTRQPGKDSQKRIARKEQPG
jgi:hypothetical protein